MVDSIFINLNFSDLTNGIVFVSNCNSTVCPRSSDKFYVVT